MDEHAHQITSHEAVTALLGEPFQRTIDKVHPALTDDDRAFLAESPFCVVATADAQGNLDVSPKGDPVGSLVHVIDERTVAIAERPGNRRADGYHNMLDNPHVGLIFLIPGRADTLRINGRACLVSDASWFDQLVVKGHRPLLAVVVDIDEVFGHCAKAFARSRLWHPETWGRDQAEIDQREDEQVSSYSVGLY